MKKVTLIPFLLILFPSLLIGGVVFEIETKDHEQSSPNVDSMQMWAEGKNLKMGIAPGSGRGQSSNSGFYSGGGSGRGYGSSPGDQGGTMYYLGDERKMVFISGSQGFSINLDSFAQMAAANPFQGMSSGGGDAPPGFPPAVWGMLPEDKRAEILRQMAESGANVPSTRGQGLSGGDEERYVDTGKTGRTSDGKRYRVWRKYVGAELKNEFKVVDWRDVPGGSQLKSVFADFSSFSNKMRESAMAGRGFDSPSGNMFNDLEEINGFPYEGVEYDRNRVVSSFTVKSMVERKLASAELYPDPNIPVQDMGQLLNQAAAGLGGLLEQMGQGNPYGGSSIDREALQRMQQQRQNNSYNNNNYGGAGSSSSMAADEAAVGGN